jgi:hypothetical protein
MLNCRVFNIALGYDLCPYLNFPEQNFNKNWAHLHDVYDFHPSEIDDHFGGRASQNDFVLRTVANTFGPRFPGK